MAEQAYSFARGVAVTLPLEMDPPTDTTGWAFAFVVRQEDEQGAAELNFTGPPGFVRVDDPTGRHRAVISHAQSMALAVGRHSWEWWRTDAGNEDRLAFGTFNVLAQDLY